MTSLLLALWCALPLQLGAALTIYANPGCPAEMGVIWFKNRPKPIALTPDGRLNLVPFKLDPDTIAINGIEGLVAKDSKSEGTFEQILSMGLFQATAGSREDPLIVEGEPLGGRQWCVY